MLGTSEGPVPYGNRASKKAIFPAPAGPTYVGAESTGGTGDDVFVGWQTPWLGG